MDKVLRQLSKNGLNIKEIELFLTWYKENNYSVKSLKEDILNSSNTLNFFKTKLPFKQHTFFILKHSLKQEIDQYVKITHDINCDVMTCPSIKRIVAALKYYKALYNNGNTNEAIFTQLIIKYFEQKYKYVISDYHHILFTHLINQTKLKHLQNYEIINNAICKNKVEKKCNINQCQQYKRYHREREEKTDDYKVSLYQDLMDTIHSYFVHGFDDGSRLKISDLSSMHKNSNQMVPNYHHITDETSVPFKDNNLKQLQNILSLQKDYVHQLRGKHRIEYNKFSNNINEIGDEKNNAIDVGHQPHFYYWNYYKNKEPFNEWYIAKKYGNFKQEMLSNKISLSMFNYILYKATILIKQSDFISTMKSSICVQYEIGEDYKITVNIIMALIFFSDFDKLRYDFVQTFKKLNAMETDQQLKNRNAEFWFLSKTLLETVECYGRQLYDEKVQMFYTGHGRNCFNMNDIGTDTQLLFGCPISATPHLEITTIYSNTGLLLELCPSSYSLKSFNCSFVSSFGLEQEMLFFGGFGRSKAVKIHSIINLNDNENYRVFIKAINLFNRLIDDKILFNKQNSNVTNMDYFIIHCLIKQQMELNKINGYKNIFPQYINNMFGKCCLNTKYVAINLKNIEYYYPGFSIICISSKCDNFVLFDEIAKLFMNCETITVDMTGHGSITCNYLSLLINAVNKISKISRKQKTKLTKIELNNVQIKCDGVELEKCKSTLSMEAWEMSIAQNEKQCNFSLTKC